MAISTRNVQSVKLTSFGSVRFAVMGIFLLLLIHTLVWAAGFILPVISALLGYFVLNRPRRWLEKIGVPPMLSAAVFTIVVVATIIGGALRFNEPVSHFLARLPAVMVEIDALLAGEGGTLDAMNEAAKAADEILEGKDAEEDTVEVKVVEDDGIAAQLAGTAPTLIGQIVFAILLLFFLISSGDMFIQKLIQSVNRLHDKRLAANIVYRIEDRLGHYLGGIALINAGLGVAIACAMWLWGMPNALVIGAMAFALNFVPFLGAIVGAGIASLMAFIAFDAIWPALGVWLTYMVLTSLEGQMVTPMLISRRMKLNTTVVFISIAFFAWIWSVMGMILALPILLVAKIVCDEIESLNTLGLFLGDQEDDIETKVAVQP